ncbi:hypothetical protein GS597_06905 [Synechococcales cyanobacterium C]|uniref:Uncharacterized protein n=1 Tax=Petrachloros mirabilis ULC683 TaxID=2781853 RepID=A0A8K2A7J0_9CYAN|nr:hypothetical protein [Petrachloros mirabilis]NCJ06249.1 hypothetical protein [Petrachloros mirabilis ULC683]
MKFSPKSIVSTASLALVQIVSIMIPFSAALAGNLTYTYTACYFQKGNDLSSITWRWGLQQNNSWYQMNGRWIMTPRTGVMTFESQMSQQNIMDSCANSQRYYQLTGYRIVGAYAADDKASKNYQIYTSNGTQLVSK